LHNRSDTDTFKLVTPPLFVSDDTIIRMAIISLLAATCKLNGINPLEDFPDIIPRVASHLANQIAEFIPTHWKNICS
jgi:hypothetical protein